MVKKMEFILENDFQNVKLHFWFLDGREETKEVTYNDFIQYIIHSDEISNTFLRVGALPSGYFDGEIDTKCSSTFKAVLTVPAGHRILRYFGEALVIPFPDMAFFFGVEQGVLKKSSVVALDNGKKMMITSDSIVCRYPFGNVYCSSEICWGRTNYPLIMSMRDVSILLELFFGSETNEDLYHAPDHFPEFASQRGLLSALDGLDVFPREWLERTDITLGNEVEQFLDSVRE